MADAIQGGRGGPPVESPPVDAPGLAAATARPAARSASPPTSHADWPLIYVLLSAMVVWSPAVAIAVLPAWPRDPPDILRTPRNTARVVRCGGS